MTRRRRPSAPPRWRLPAVLALAGVALVAVLWLVVAGRVGGESTAPAQGELAPRLRELAARRGAAGEAVRADDPIRKVDGVFVRHWRVELDSREAVRSLAADLEAEAARRQAGVTRPAPVGGAVERVRIDLGDEAFDVALVVSPPQPQVAAAATPTPEPTATPRPQPPAGARGRLAILLDDAGQSVDLVAEVAALPDPVGVAVLPFLPASAETAVVVHQAGHEVWLHLPMEPRGYPGRNPGPGAIFTSMTEPELRTTVHTALNNIPHVVGVNNHMGSRATADLRVMTWVMQELKSRGVAFLDSRTTVETVAEDAARAQGVPTGRRHVFLDNRRTRRDVRRQLDEAVYRSRMEGEIVAIGHVNRVTVSVLAAELAGLQARGADLVPPSELMR